MDEYELILALLGLAFLGAAWLPRFLHGRPLSFPIIYVALGLLLFELPFEFVNTDPTDNHPGVERLTEMLVIVALMGTGLKLDRKLSLRDWAVTWRLLAVTMPLTIAAASFLGWWVLGLAPAAALLFGAVLAPTDPVLASDVQVGPPGEGDEDQVRFGLTSEAGLNDGLAFPFTYLAILVATYGLDPSQWIGEWLVFHVLYKIVSGVALGWFLGSQLMRFIFHLKARNRLAETGEGFVGLALTLFIYGVTELLQGYGFLAVFVSALAVRRYERAHKYHASLHDFVEQTERILMVIALVLFGGSIAGGLFSDISWSEVFVGALLLFVVRPLFGLLALVGSKAPLREKLAISFLGIRGIGSFYYLSYALNEADFPGADTLWASVGLVVLGSIIIHGVTAPFFIGHLDAKREREEERPTRSLRTESVGASA